MHTIMHGAVDDVMQEGSRENTWSESDLNTFLLIKEFLNSISF